MAIYQILPGGVFLESPSTPRASSLNIKFVKVFTRTFQLQKLDETEKSTV